MRLNLDAILLLAPSTIAQFTPFAETLSTLKFSKNLPRGLEKTYDLEQPLVITSPDDASKQYNCYSPKTTPDKDTAVEDEPQLEYESPYHLLEHHFKDDSDCFLMADGYWMYELCFNRYIRQFHEDRVSNGKMNVKSFSMGKNPKMVKDGPLELPVPRTYHDKTTYPYYAVVFENGDVCDLTHKLRKTTVQFTCDLDHTGNGHQSIQIMSMQETASCEYEFLVASGAICAHPLFKRETHSNDIICVAKDDTVPALPEGAAHLNGLALKGRKTIDYDNSIATLLQDEAKPSTPPEGASQIVTPGDGDSKDNILPSSNYEKQYSSLDSLLKAFVLGDSCLHGGSGWWRYEYCYGRYVKQFHEDKNGKTDIFLGYWDYDVHMKWAKDSMKLGLKNSWYSQSTSFKTTTKPKLPTYYLEDSKKVMTASIFMKGGDVCDLTGNPRTVHVRHICNKSIMKVNMILHEPADCQYVLNVESLAFCKYLEEVDEYGMTVELETADSYLDKIKSWKAGTTPPPDSHTKPVTPKPSSDPSPTQQPAHLAQANGKGKIAATMESILKNLENEIDFEQLGAEKLKIKTVDGQDMEIDPKKLGDLLQNPGGLAQKIQELMDKQSAQNMDPVPERASTAPQYRVLPKVTVPWTERLSNAVIEWNDIVEEIVEYISDDENFGYGPAVRAGHRSLMEVLATEDPELIKQFYAARVMLINLGVPAFRAYDLQDLVAGIDDMSIIQIPEEGIPEEFERDGYLDIDEDPNEDFEEDEYLSESDDSAADPTEEPVPKTEL